MPQTPPPTTAQRILTLKEQAASTQRLRAQAEAAVNLATSQVAQVDAELTRLGVTPDNCEAELAALEAQLEQSITEFEARVAQEAQECTNILTTARQANLVQ